MLHSDFLSGSPEKINCLTHLIKGCAEAGTTEAQADSNRLINKGGAKRHGLRLHSKTQIPMGTREAL